LLKIDEGYIFGVDSTGRYNTFVTSRI